MGRSRKKGRDLDGVVLIDKPLGASSNQVLQKVRWLFDAKKAGHTGALDPLASGLLPVCFGNATKFAQFSLDADKTYEVTAKLGIRTTTSDADGEVVATHPVEVTDEQLAQALEQFRGGIKQVPSMFSALKHQGKPLYHYARQGITIERPARDINIYLLQLNRFECDEVDLTVHCSKGTYIRSLVDDLGQVLGCGAYVTKLHRTHVSGYADLPMISPQQLEALKEAQGIEAIDKLLLPTDEPIKHLEIVYLDAVEEPRFVQGQQLKYAGSGTGTVRVYGADKQTFLGIAEIQQKVLSPKRLVS